MTSLPRAYIERYSDALNRLSAQARKKLLGELERIDYSADVEVIREKAIAIMQRYCGASAETAARVAAEFYNGLSLIETGEAYAAAAVSKRQPEATSVAVRVIAKYILDGNVHSFVNGCADRMDYETRRAANECMAENARTDPRNPKWARVPSGDETCQWCIMLASRGFAYHSAETASHAHAHCDCRIIPGWTGYTSIDGYDPDLYYDMWKHPEKYDLK